MTSKIKAILLLVLLVTCLAGGWMFSRFREKSRIKYIFILTIDTLRADHLGCYGYPRNTSPFIDSLAEKGVLFEKAISQSATTCPSHASIFTGLYPSQHRVLNNGVVLDDSVTTLAEILKENNFRTAAFTSTSGHFFSSHIHRGFSFYDEPNNPYLTYKMRYRPAEQTIDHAVLWLANFDSANKLFLWVHLYDPHRPFRKPELIYKELDVPEERNAFMEQLEKKRINLEMFQNDPQIAYEYITTYDAEIRYADNELRRLFRVAEKKGMLKDSLWIITSDHGESLGQHNWLSHSTVLYQEDIRVPLIFFKGGPKPFHPRRVKPVVENFAIFPTLLELVKIKLDQKIAREMQALSLLPQIYHDARKMGKGFAFSERDHFSKQPPSFAPDVPFWNRIWEDGEKYAIQNQHWKFIYRTKFEHELYDLENDPFELINRIADRHNIPDYAVLFNETMNRLRYFEKYKVKKVKKADRKAISRLKSLGYL